MTVPRQYPLPPFGAGTKDEEYVLDPPGNAGGAGIPQGGPLTVDLATDDFQLIGGPSALGADAGGLQVTKPFAGNGGNVSVFGGNGAAGLAGGQISLQGGSGDNGNDAPANISVNGGDGLGNAGSVNIITNQSSGAAGEVLQNGLNGLSWLDVTRVSFGPPALGVFQTPLIFDNTPVTGGLYAWIAFLGGYVKVSTIP